MSVRQQETEGLVPGEAPTRYDGTVSPDTRPSVDTTVQRSDDAYLAMMDPNSLSPGRKRLFVAGMVLASFLASLDLTGESVLGHVSAAGTDRNSGCDVYTDDLE